MMKRCIALIICFILLWPMAALAADGLNVGSTGQAVTKLQERLTELGLFSGKTDGIYGEQTAIAVKEAQRLLALAGHSVQETGNADKNTLTLINDENAEPALMTLCVGSKNARVRALQSRLIDLKLLDGAADGAYGNATKAAVERFQRELLGLGADGITVTGVADIPTQALLDEDLSQYGFRAPIYFDETNPLGLSEEYLYAKSCLLMDGPTGEVLFDINGRQQMYPASTTKILTLLVSLAAGGLNDTITIPESAADVPADSSLVPVSTGEKMTKLNLLYGLMIRSGNDAANAIAELDAGSVEKFVALMNQKAAELGMTSSHFSNPHGYHDGDHYTTAYDLARATRAGLTDPTFCQIVTCLNYTLPATNKRDELTIKNVYEIFDPYSDYYLPYAAGVKSGYTSLAGFCYVGAAQKDGRTLIAVILNAPSRNRAWLDLKKLFEYGFAK